MSETSPMSLAFEVGFLAFDGVDAADRVIGGLRERGATHLVNDIAALEHHASGKFSLHAYSDESTRASKVAGGMAVGSLTAMLLLGPLGFLAGALGGGLVGWTLGGRDPHDIGLSEEFMRGIRDALPPDSSAVLVLGEPEVVGELVGEVRRGDIAVRTEIRHPLTDEQAAAIREAIEKQRQR
jgi:uncharacterized membrane protein